MMKKILFIIQLVAIVSSAYFFQADWGNNDNSQKWVVYAKDSEGSRLYLALLDSTSRPYQKKSVDVSAKLLAKAGLADTIVDLHFKMGKTAAFSQVKPCQKSLHVIHPKYIGYCEYGVDLSKIKPALLKTPLIDTLLICDKNSLVYFVGVDRGDNNSGAMESLTLAVAEQTKNQGREDAYRYSAGGRDIYIKCDELAVEAFPVNLYSENKLFLR